MELLTASPETWTRAAAVIRAGGLVVFPTDTVYGVGCDPYNRAAIERIYAAKGREHTKAIPLLLSGVEEIGKVALSVPSSAAMLGKAFWPGALTLVVPRGADLPAELGGGATIAIRVPGLVAARAFIAACGGALATTSANLSGQPDALDARQACEYLGNSVDLVIDGGMSGETLPSTLVDCTATPPRILRQGAIAEQLIRSALYE